MLIRPEPLFWDQNVLYRTQKLDMDAAVYASSIMQQLSEDRRERILTPVCMSELFSRDRHMVQLFPLNETVTPGALLMSPSLLEFCRKRIFKL